MRNRVTSHPIDPGRGIDVFDAVGFSQSTRRDLSGSSLFTWIGGGKGKLAAGAHRQPPADDALLSHADTNERICMAVLFQKLHHDHIVIERTGRGHDLDEV